MDQCGVTTLRRYDSQKGDHLNELECLTLVWAFKKLRHYFFGRQFQVKTDKNVVKWLCSKKE
jgi:hypothetical protein